MKHIFSFSGFNRVLAMVGINNLAGSLISVFVAIYILELGYSLQQVIGYLAIHHGVLLLASFCAVFISNRFGLVRVLMLRFVFLIGYLLLLFSLEHNPSVFFIIPILSGIESGFYWTPLNILMVRKTQYKNIGTSLSRFLVVPKIISFLGPVIAAFVVAQYGFPALFIVAIAIFICSIIPIIPLRSEITEFSFTWKRAREIYKKHKHFFIPEVIDNLAEDAMVFWSIMIFLSLSDIFHVGLIATTVSVTSLLFTMFLGKLSDLKNKLSLVRIGAWLIVCAWIGNFFIAQFGVEPWLFYVGTIVVSFAMKTFLIPYGSLLYNQARKDDAQFLVLREIPTILGRQLLFLCAFIFSSNLSVLFLLVGVLFIYFIFWKPKLLSLE